MGELDRIVDASGPVDEKDSGRVPLAREEEEVCFRDRFEAIDEERPEMFPTRDVVADDNDDDDEEGDDG